VANYAGQKYGFEFVDSVVHTINSVVVTGPTQLQITLAGIPSGSGMLLRYAWTGILTNNSGPTAGPRGCIRDSDTTPSLFGFNLYNWLITCSVPIT
jgi:hypothetical protein